MINVGKAINGIGLNGLEWLLDEDNKVIDFENKEEAIKHLRDAGIDLTDEEMEDAFTFKDTEE